MANSGKKLSPTTGAKAQHEAQLIGEEWHWLDEVAVSSVLSIVFAYNPELDTYAIVPLQKANGIFTRLPMLRFYAHDVEANEALQRFVYFDYASPSFNTDKWDFDLPGDLRKLDVIHLQSMLVCFAERIDGTAYEIHYQSFHKNGHVNHPPIQITSKNYHVVQSALERFCNDEYPEYNNFAPTIAAAPAQYRASLPRQNYSDDT